MRNMKKRATYAIAVRTCFALLLIMAGFMISNIDCEADTVNEKIVEYNLIVTDIPENVPSIVEHEPSQQEPTTGRYTSISEEITQKERGLLALVIYHESRGECIEGQEAVAETVLNRYLSGFDGKATIEDIIYAENQFSCSPYLTTASIREPGCLATAFDVIDKVISETDYKIKDTYMYFNTKQPKTSDYVKIGNHYFY